MRALVVVPMQIFSYRPGPTLRTPGAVQEKRAREIHRRLDPLVEDPDLRPSRIPMMCPWTIDLVARAELQDLGGIGDRERDLVRRHHVALVRSIRQGRCAPMRGALPSTGS